MDPKKALELSLMIIKDVFGKDISMNLEQIKKKFAYDITLPRKVICSLTGQETWTHEKKDLKVASQTAMEEEFKKSEWMRPKKQLLTVYDVITAWQKVNYVTGEKYISSLDVINSDSINTSSFVYESVSIFDSKNIIFCAQNSHSEYLLASQDNGYCNFGIRLNESIYCSSSYEVSWSKKVSKSMFIHNSFDLYECLFCSFIASKKYCIANMQFEKEEYFKVKEMIINQLLK